MTKAERMRVYNKYNGRCAYCGRQIEYKDMQVDHIEPKRIYYAYPEKADRIENLNPACRRCNHYKRAHSLKTYRELICKLHTKVRDMYLCKVAEDYGIITVNEWDGKFYFEKAIGVGRDAE